MRNKVKILQQSSGQSTVEYIILATAVMAVVLIFFNGSGSQFQTKLNGTFEQTAQDITDRSEKLQETHGSDAGKWKAPNAALGVNAMGKIF